MKRLIRKTANVSNNQISKAKDLCKAMKNALEKNDRDKLLELKDEICLYHPDTLYSGKIYRAIFLNKKNFKEDLTKKELEEAVRKQIYINNDVVSFSKTLNGAKSGALDWNGKKKDAYLVIVSEDGQGLDLNEVAKTCKEMFDKVKENVNKDKNIKQTKRTDFRKKLTDVSKEMKEYFTGKYDEVDEVIDQLRKDYKIEKIIEV